MQQRQLRGELRSCNNMYGDGLVEYKHILLPFLQIIVQTMGSPEQMLRKFNILCISK